MIKTLTDPEVVMKYGNPDSYLRPDGTPGAVWEANILTTLELPAPLPLSWDRYTKVKVIRCHRLIASRLKLALDVIYTAPEVWASIDDYGGCYNYRAITGNRNRLSRHSWGIAIDLDVEDNPYRSHLGDSTTHAFIRDAFESQGFAWGGNFTIPDPMHFEIGKYNAS